MIEGLSEEQLLEVLSSDKFVKGYKTYEKNKDVDKLSNFFDDIETNKNYFRLNVKKSRKYLNKNNDTDIIKSINSNINKCTDTNYKSMMKLIINDINKNEHLLSLVIESILEKCIVHHHFVHIYVKILEEINKNNNIIRVLNNTLNKYYGFIFDHKIVGSDNTYDNLCNENRQTDNKIGYLMLITHLDINNVVCDRISDLIKNIMNDILDKDNDEIFKLLNCLLNIGSISTKYLNDHMDVIKQLKDKKYDSKVRCKVMDIGDLF